MDAERAYIFRNVLLRDAAYQLHLPSARAKLHRLALQLLEEHMPDAERDPLAHEFADHAAAGGAAFRAKELAYLERAAIWFEKQYQLPSALRACERILSHALLKKSQRVAWLSRAGSIALRHGKLREALGFVEAALEGAGNLSEKAAAARLVAVVCDALGERERALAMFELSLEHARAGHDDAAQARGLVGLAHLLNRMGKSGDAGIQFELARGAYENVTDAEGLFNMRLYYAQYLLQNGRIADAEVLLLVAEQAARRAHDRPNLARILNMRGVARDYRGQPNEGEPLLQEAAALALEINDLRQLSVVQSNLALIWNKQGHNAKAREVYAGNLALVREMGELSEEAIALGNLASLDYAMGRTEEGERGYRQALEVARRTGDRRDQGRFLAALAMIAHKRGDENECARCFAQALELFRASKNRRNEAIVIMEMGEVAAERALRETAIEHYREALKIFIEIRDEHHAENVRMELRKLGAV